MTDGCRYASVSTSRSGTAGAGFSQLRVLFCNLKILVGKFSLQDKHQNLVALFHCSKSHSEGRESEREKNISVRLIGYLLHALNWEPDP